MKRSHYGASTPFQNLFGCWTEVVVLNRGHGVGIRRRGKLMAISIGRTEITSLVA